MVYILWVIFFLSSCGIADVLCQNVTQYPIAGFTLNIPMLPDCWCSCEPAHVPEDKPGYDEYVKQWKHNLLQNLLLNQEELYATRFKKMSAEDNRTSAISVGCVGVVILALSAVMIVVLDLTNMKSLSFLFKGKSP